MSGRTGQVVVSGALLALGVAFAVGTWLLPNPPSYAQVGPRLFPALIAGGVIFISLALLREALSTGYRNVPEGDVKPINWPAIAWLAAAMAVQMMFIAKLGFILTSTLLFFAVARAFGSRRTRRDALIGLVLTTAAFFLFTQVLTLSLPWGEWLPDIMESVEDEPLDSDGPSEPMPGEAPADAAGADGQKAQEGAAK